MQAQSLLRVPAIGSPKTKIDWTVWKSDVITEQVFRKLENVAYAMGIDAAII